MFEACIFDFDGVLIDSEPLHAQAKQSTLEYFRVKYPAQLFSDFKGRPDSEFFQYVAAQLAGGIAGAEAMDAYKRARYLQLFENVSLVPGAESFLAAARSRFKKLGLATSATRRDFSLAARKYQLDRWFDVIITGEDTSSHKPDPEPYLQTLEALGVAGAVTLVIEDSPNGVRSAKAAGCTAAALTTSFTVADLLDAGAEVVVASFIELGQELSMVLPEILKP